MNSDNGAFYDDYDKSHEDEFFDAAEAAMIGYYIGDKIDQTRFGIWFNENRTIDLVYRLVGLAILGWFSWAVVLFIYYTICLVLG